jgi:hypothetical protein
MAEISEETILRVAADILSVGRAPPKEDTNNQKIIGKLIHLIVKRPEASDQLLACLSDCAEYMRRKGHEGHFAVAKIYAESHRQSHALPLQNRGSGDRR